MRGWTFEHFNKRFHERLNGIYQFQFLKLNIIPGSIAIKNPNLISKIDESWIKTRLRRCGYSRDDTDSSSWYPIVPFQSFEGEIGRINDAFSISMTYDDWIIAFDRLIDDIGQDISLNCSDEEITVAFYWFIFDRQNDIFSELYSNLLNPTQKERKLFAEFQIYY